MNTPHMHVWDAPDIRRNVIVEGPDGSGKSTLIGHLSDRLGLKVHERASDSKTGPVEDLAGWVDRDISTDWTDRWIYDRYPVISEPIYGPHARRLIRAPFGNPAYIANVNEVLYRTATVVWCLPPEAVVVENVTSTIANQMDGVVANIRRIYQAYVTAYFRWRGSKLLWDYGRHDLSLFVENLTKEITRDRAHD